DAGYDYLVVNDGSTDATLQLCQDHNINVLNLSENLGIGGAIQAGHKYAHDHNYAIDIQFDGDGQHDAAHIPSLIAAIEQGADLAIGSRFLGEESGFRSSFMRRMGIRWLSFWIKLVSHKKVTDPTSGFRACNQATIALFCRDYPTDYPEPESIVTALKHRLSVTEVPVVMHERQSGASSINALGSIYYMVKVSLAIAILGLSKQKEA
ncbi:MAG: glycosyltransferase family 2 protein, partial [Clostridia bacterium]